jgi:hypothetical protein
MKKAAKVRWALNGCLSAIIGTEQGHCESSSVGGDSGRFWFTSQPAAKGAPTQAATSNATTALSVVTAHRGVVFGEASSPA